MKENTVCDHNQNDLPLQSRKNLKARVTLKLVAFLALLPGLLSAAPAAKDSGATGYLSVFSATREVQWGEGSYYYPHTGYRVLNSSGRAVMWVDNNGGGVDPAPEKIELPAGTYTVWAQSEHDGYVKTTVVVRPTRLTELHLDGENAVVPAKAVAVSRNHISCLGS